MEKSTKRETQYRAILERKSLRLEDCLVLAFVFPSNVPCFLFHYDLMNSKHITYYFFDLIGRKVFVIAPKDADNERRIIEYAAYRDGERVEPNLR